MTAGYIAIPSLPLITPPFLARMARARCLSCPLREPWVAAVVLLAASAVERLQDWIPDFLAIPEDAELVNDRAIGLTVRLLSIATEIDTEVLLAAWKKALDANGYLTGNQGEGGSFESLIEFSGPDIQTAKIFVAFEGAGHSLIPKDPSLRKPRAPHKLGGQTGMIVLPVRRHGKNADFLDRSGVQREDHIRARTRGENLSHCGIDIGVTRPQQSRPRV